MKKVPFEFGIGLGSAFLNGKKTAKQMDGFGGRGGGGGGRGGGAGGFVNVRLHFFCYRNLLLKIFHHSLLSQEPNFFRIHNPFSGFFFSFLFFSFFFFSLPKSLEFSTF